MVYVPAEVLLPLGSVGFELEPPPPQAQSVSASIGAKAHAFAGRSALAALANFANTRHPRSASIQRTKPGSNRNGNICEPAVVVTLTLNGVGFVALIVTLFGTEHAAPAGVPVQLSDAVPLIPVPPTARA
jgi:hypothetical protein